MDLFLSIFSQFILSNSDLLKPVIKANLVNFKCSGFDNSLKATSRRLSLSLLKKDILASPEPLTFNDLEGFPMIYAPLSSRAQSIRILMIPVFSSSH